MGSVPVNRQSPAGLATRRLHICVLHHACPTEQEPYRGAPIWATISALREFADLTVCCSVPQYPAMLRRMLASRNVVHTSPADLARAPVPTHGIAHFAFPQLSRRFNGLLLARSFTPFVRRMQPDVVLGYFLYPECFAAVAAARANGVPVVIGSRGSDLKVVARDPVIAAQIRRTVERANAMVCVSHDLAEVARRMGARPDTLFTIHNGIDHTVFHYREQSETRSSLGLSLDERIVLYVGRLVPNKGISNLLRAVAMLDGWRLVLIGAGSQESELRDQARELGLEDRARFLGAVPRQTVAAWMNACDLFCLPSETEGCPNVLLEALACGRPAVATAVGGIPELIDSSCGVLLPSNEPAGLAHALRTAAETAWDRGAIARRWRRTWTDVARETYEICRRVCK